MKSNREKAQALAKALAQPMRDGKLFVERLEEELNRLDLPQPKKWEPRGGEFYMDHVNQIKEGHSTDGCRLAGREYPTREEAERAAPLHRKIDRLVNWLVENCQGGDEIEVNIDTAPLGSVIVMFAGTHEVGAQLLRKINSGEVEL